MALDIRKAKTGDREAVWQILHGINAKEDSFAFSADLGKDKMLEYWFEAKKHVYVAVEEDKVLGSFFFKENQPGLGSHIANAAYAVSPFASGKGIGKAMGEFSLDEAKRMGFRAMQFNLVVKTNEPAVKLWKSLGFEIIGEIPEAFRHGRLGFVNAYIMYRKL